MFRIMIVEDESDILAGIINNCQWEKHHFSPPFAAINGKDALEQMAIKQPDFVITDVKMPIMDGMTLIREASALYPDMLFALLTGFEDFENAKNLLQYNVLDYLTKPCNINAIHDLLDQAFDRLERLFEKKNYSRMIEENYHNLQSLLQEQVLKDYVINPSYREIELSSYKNLPGLKSCHLRIILLHIDEVDWQLDHYSLMTLCKEYFSNTNQVYLCSICNEHILVIINYTPYPELYETLQKIKQAFSFYHDKTLSIAVGEETSISHIKDSYQNLLACLRTKFHSGTGSIITTYDLPPIKKPISIENFHMEYLTLALKSGNREELDEILNHLFAQLNKKEYYVSEIRAYTVKVFVLLLQEVTDDQFDQYLTGIQQINNSSSIDEIQAIIQNTAHEIMAALYENVHQCQNNIVKQILDLITRYLGDERLSLNFIANEILYLNVDYLGKLFKSETNEKFSRYVANKRIEKAKELFAENSTISVNEVARLIGFGYNAQYFSKVFKSNTGYTPKEYLNKFCRGNH